MYLAALELSLACKDVGCASPDGDVINIINDVDCHHTDPDRSGQPSRAPILN